jgi:hypothetical protein
MSSPDNINDPQPNISDVVEFSEHCDMIQGLPDIAVLQTDIGLVRTLLDAGADSNSVKLRSGRQSNPILRAIELHAYQIMRLLVQRGEALEVD